MEMEVRSKLNPWYFFLNISLINAIFIYKNYNQNLLLKISSTSMGKGKSSGKNVSG